MQNEIKYYLVCYHTCSIGGKWGRSKFGKNEITASSKKMVGWVLAPRDEIVWELDVVSKGVLHKYNFLGKAGIFPF